MSNQEVSGCRALPPKVFQKFYEPVVLLQALNMAIKARDTANPASVTESVDRADDKQVFQAFVYKLAYICDNIKGNNGKTVSAFAVLRDPDTENGIEYLFTSNGRTAKELEEVRSYMGSVLGRISEASDVDDGGRCQKEVLKRVVNFNKRRIIVYMAAIDSQIDECLRYCENQSDDEDQLVNEIIKSQLAKIKRRLDFQSQVTWSPDMFVSKYETLSRKLWELFELPGASQLIKTRALEGRLSDMRSVDCWSEFRHATTRIIAYITSVQFLLLAKSKWPELFTQFQVTFLPSSRPDPKPGREKSYSAEKIVGRMTRKEKEMNIFKSFVKTLQLFDLDERVKNEYQRPGFRPIVHSEVLLLDWLANNRDGLVSETFFNGWKYIGSSKPTCKLCHYYFEEHRSGVECRTTHGTLYTAWRFPDVPNSLGDKGDEARQFMLDRVLQRIRKDAFELVRRKVELKFRVHDSLTSSAKLTLDERWRLGQTVATDDADDVASLMGSLDLEDRGGPPLAI